MSLIDKVGEVKQVYLSDIVELTEPTPVCISITVLVLFWSEGQWCRVTRSMSWTDTTTVPKYQGLNTALRQVDSLFFLPITQNILNILFLVYFQYVPVILQPLTPLSNCYSGHESFRDHKNRLLSNLNPLGWG